MINDDQCQLPTVLSDVLVQPLLWKLVLTLRSLTHAPFLHVAVSSSVWSTSSGKHIPFAVGSWLLI